MEPFGDILAGSGSSDGEHQKYEVKLVANHCYVFIAASGPGIEDLDTLVRDPGGEIVQKDEEEDTWPTLVYCPEKSGNYQFEISVGEGKGRFHSQVWHTKNTR